MTTKSEIIYESKTKHLRYLFDEQGNALPIYNDILDKFTTDEKVGLTTIAGSVIFNIDTNKIEYYNGSSWKEIN